MALCVSFKICLLFYSVCQKTLIFKSLIKKRQRQCLFRTNWRFLTNTNYTHEMFIDKFQTTFNTKLTN